MMSILHDLRKELTLHGIRHLDGEFYITNDARELVFKLVAPYDGMLFVNIANSRALPTEIDLMDEQGNSLDLVTIAYRVVQTINGKWFDSAWRAPLIILQTILDCSKHTPVKITWSMIMNFIKMPSVNFSSTKTWLIQQEYMIADGDNVSVTEAGQAYLNDMGNNIYERHYS